MSIAPLDFMQTLWQLNHALERMSSLMEQRLGVTAQQRMILCCIRKQKDTTPSILAELLHVERSTISIALNRLERDGWLSRHVDPNDRRQVFLRLTAKGRRCNRARGATVESRVRSMLKKNPSGDVKVAIRVISSLVDELEAASG